MSDVDPKLERLAHLELSVDLPETLLALVADLTLRLHQANARRAGAILAPAMMRPYSERSDTERLGMRSAVQHVLHALILLEVVDVRR